jgi:hypothetical protein
MQPTEQDAAYLWDMLDAAAYRSDAAIIESAK